MSHKKYTFAFIHIKHPDLPLVEVCLEKKSYITDVENMYLVAEREGLDTELLAILFDSMADTFGDLCDRCTEEQDLVGGFLETFKYYAMDFQWKRIK